VPLPNTGTDTLVQLVLAAILLLTGSTLARVSRRGTLPA
jgi:LPXTG-motif cell wall-anchored protein